MAGRSSPRPRRVVMLTASLSNGGLERQLVLLARNLPAAWRPYIWSLDGGPYEEVCRRAGLPLCIGGRRGRFDVSPAVGLWRSLARLRPHAVHSWHWIGSATAWPWCRATGVPLIDGSIRRGDVPRERGRPHRFFVRRADAVVANSRAGLAAWGLDGPRCRVIYNGFDDGRLEGVRPRRVPGRFTVVMAARMSPDKDHRCVIRAARLLLERRLPADPAAQAALPADDLPAWRFLFVGGGERQEALRSEAADLITAGAVEFVDGGLEPLDHVAGADVGVLMTDPSYLAEGCSNAVMEYMACGLPVVCADSGGNRELVVDGETGYVVPPRSDEALAARLADLRARPVVAARLGAAGRERIATRFSVARLVDDWTALYAEVSARRTPVYGS